MNQPPTMMFVAEPMLVTLRELVTAGDVAAVPDTVRAYGVVNPSNVRAAERALPAIFMSHLPAIREQGSAAMDYSVADDGWAKSIRESATSPRLVGVVASIVREIEVRGAA